MKQKHSASFLPKKLTSLSLDDGQGISVEKVKAILQVLRNKPAHILKPLLKKYQFFLLRENRKKEALLEYAGTIAKDEIMSIKKSLEDYYGHEIDISHHENNQLLAGFRVSIGDDIWEASLANNLRHLLSKN